MRKYILIAIIFFALIVPAVSAAPEQVKVGTYLLNIGEYDIEKGSYTADFYLWFEWDGENSPVDFEFMNGRAEKIDVAEDEPGSLFYRVEAHLYENIDMHDYPRDVQRVSIKIEDSSLTTEDIVYVPYTGEIGVSPEMRILGWEIREGKAEISETYYANWDETYSRYTYTLELKRPGSAFYRMIIPIIFIAFTAWICFFLPLKRIGEKLTLGGTALLSAVAFHIYLTASIPPLGYLTLADKAMISLYALLVSALMGMILTEMHLTKERPDKARKTNMIYAGLCLLAPIIMFFVLQWV